ncbi:hypothetical protein V5O48_009962 [Marasmius crinis-equi]|uniref:Uncharacterized protein n=1 Tax=Marasmius crinis-equi TaxID=585013 RepID=A0ABR3F9S7_9AGAR
MVENTDKPAQMSEHPATTPEKTVSAAQQVQVPIEQAGSHTGNAAPEEKNKVHKKTDKITFKGPQLAKLREQYPKYLADKTLLTKIVAQLVGNVEELKCPPDRDVATWNSSVRRWFQNKKYNNHNRQAAEDTGNLEEPATMPESSSAPAPSTAASAPSTTPSPASVPSTSPQPGLHLTTAKIREIYKTFARFTQQVEVSTGLDEFRADPTVMQQVESMVSAENGNRNVIASGLWKNLSPSERDSWEERALSKVNVQENQEAFSNSLRTMLAGCVQFGHVGRAQASVVLSFEDPDNAGKAYTKRFVECWDPDFSGLYEIEDEIDQYLTAVSERVLEGTLQSSLKDLPLKDRLNLKHNIPQDMDGKARFPTLDMNNTTAGALKEVYLDFMCCVWFQAGHQGDVDYDSILSNPDQFYDHSSYPNVSIILPHSNPFMFGPAGSDLHEHHSLSGTAFELRPVLARDDRASNEPVKDELANNNTSNETSTFNASKTSDLDHEQDEDVTNERLVDPGDRVMSAEHSRAEVGAAGTPRHDAPTGMTPAAKDPMEQELTDSQVDETTEQEQLDDRMSSPFPAPVRDNKGRKEQDSHVEEGMEDGNRADLVATPPLPAEEHEGHTEGSGRDGKKRKAGEAQSDKPPKLRRLRKQDNLTNDLQPSSARDGEDGEGAGEGNVQSQKKGRGKSIKVTAVVPAAPPDPEDMTAQEYEEYLDSITLGKRGKDTEKWVYERQPLQMKGSVQITPKKDTVPGRVTTRAGSRRQAPGK